MRIEKLDMIGFKTFVDKAEFIFEPGITAVVGPNGCGKSNIADALRWVLGEQSARSLRGGRMEDVIFHGSKTRSPVGMAEVSLVFDNDDGILPFGYKQVEVTRRLYRSGESEYMINQAPCRLKDITEAFMDTGIGMSFYSILEQGQIEQIITSKPQERRAILEEAAGVSKYKHKKNIALRKLDATQQNLVRVGDILIEVTRQRNSLKRQVSKAKRYKAFQKESGVLELCLAYFDMDQITEEKQLYQEKLKTRESDEALISAAIAQLETELDEKKLKRVEAEKHLESSQHDLHQRDRAVDGCESRIKFSMQQIQDLEAQKVSFVAEVNELRKRMKEREEEIVRTQELQKQVITALEEYQSRMTECQERQTGKETDVNDNVRELESLQKQLFQYVTRLQEINGNIQVRSERDNRLETEIGELQAEEQQSVSTREKLSNEMGQLKALIIQKDEELHKFRDDQQALQQMISAKRANLLECNDKLAKLRRELDMVMGRKESLSDLVAGYEGFSDGVKTIMKQSGTSIGWTPEGVIADYIETSSDLETVIEVALSDLLQSVFVDDYPRAKQAIDYLRTEKKGRCRFVPMSNGAGPGLPVSSNGWEKEDGVVGRLAQLIEISGNAPKALKTIFENIILVEDIEAALRLRTNGFTGRIVTRGGEVIDPDGALAGGIGQGLGTGHLRRKREITRLMKTGQDMENKVAESEATARKVAQELENLDQELEAMEKTIHELDLERVNLKKDYEKLEYDSRQLENRIQRCVNDINSRKNERQKLQQEIIEQKEKLHSTVNMKEDMEGAIRAQGEKVEKLRVELETCRNEVTGLKIEISAAEEKNSNYSKDIERFREDIKLVTATIDSKSAKVEELNTRIKQSYADIKQEEQKLAEEVAERERLRVETEKRRLVYEELFRDIERMEKEVKEKTAELKPVIEDLTEIRSQLHTLDYQYSHVKQKVDELTPIAGDEALQRYKAEDFDADSLHKRLEHIKTVMGKMGEINLAAIEEYNVLDERFQFLTTQKKDLEESIQNLHDTITRINKTSREKFMHCFNIVNEQFHNVFLELFEGGDAHLTLVEGIDVLEAGIEIHVTLPGKKSQRLSLLSGGERTMTALALLIAIYLYKPSPFCLMDEVDAALDDANVLRFLKILKKMAQTSQIIIITHNKRTMEKCDAIYGITMEEAGASKMISVKMAA